VHHLIDGPGFAAVAIKGNSLLSRAETSGWLEMTLRVARCVLAVM
jgi:hypothetical protein